MLSFRSRAIYRVVLSGLVLLGSRDVEGQLQWIGPTSMAIAPDGKVLYVAGERACQVIVVDLGTYLGSELLIYTHQTNAVL